MSLDINPLLRVTLATLFTSVNSYGCHNGLSAPPWSPVKPSISYLVPLHGPGMLSFACFPAIRHSVCKNHSSMKVFQ